MKKSLIIGLLSVGTFVILIVGMGISASNKEVALRSKIEAQKQVVESYYDKMWKVISQKAQVTDQYKDAFKDIYPKLIEGRYGNENGGTLMKWITESNPTFDVSLYKDLMASIEAERASFTMEEKRLFDLANQHRIVLNSFPSSIFVGGRGEIEITVVSSAKTKEVMKTGEENDINLFKSENK